MGSELSKLIHTLPSSHLFIHSLEVNLHATTYVDSKSQRSGYDAEYGHTDSVTDAACRVRHSNRSTYPDLYKTGEMSQLQDDSNGARYESLSGLEVPPQQSSSHFTGHHHRMDGRDQCSDPQFFEGQLPIDSNSDPRLHVWGKPKSQNSNRYQQYSVERPFRYSTDGLGAKPQTELDYHRDHQDHNILFTTKSDQRIPHNVSSHPDEMGTEHELAGRLLPEFNKLPELDQEFRRLGLTEAGPGGEVRQHENLTRRAAALEGHRMRSLHHSPYLPPDLPWGMPDLRGFVEGAQMAPLQRTPTYSLSHPPLSPRYIPSYPNLPSPTYLPSTHSQPLPDELLLRYPVVSPYPPDRLSLDPRFGHVMPEVSSPYIIDDGFDLFKFVGRYYGGISESYNQAGELELQQILDRPLDSVLASDPIKNPIPIDYGYGMMKSLNEYGVKKDQLDCIDAICLDDLYLFEQVLRNDTFLVESERLRRWNRRMRWEEMPNRERHDLWKKMSDADKGMLGIDAGGWWAYRLSMIQLDTTYGHRRLLVGAGSLFERHNSGFRKGAFDAHYPLSSGLKVKYPFWRDGGFGLGRSLIKWLELPTLEIQPDTQASNEALLTTTPSSGIDDTAIQAMLEARQQLDLQRQREDELMARKAAAEYRRAHLMASVRAQASIPLSPSQLAFAPPHGPPRPVHTDYLEYGATHHPSYKMTYPLYEPSWPCPDPFLPTHHDPHVYLAGWNPAPVLPTSSLGPRIGPSHASPPSLHRSATGLPWGTLHSELRKRRARGGDQASSSKPQSSSQSHPQEHETRKATEPQDEQGLRAHTKEAEASNGNSDGNEKKIGTNERMDSLSSITSQVPPPPAYKPKNSGTNNKGSLPQPPMHFKVEDFKKPEWGRPIPERQPTTRDI
ncbi:hypothetical protein CROQUDRAFT_655096, partial [Cronartium quercuum f. sp. fusiforme G11]